MDCVLRVAGKGKEQSRDSLLASFPIPFVEQESLLVSMVTQWGMNLEDYFLPIYNRSFLFTRSGTNVAPAAGLAKGPRKGEFHTAFHATPCDPAPPLPAPEVLQLLHLGLCLEL